MSRSPDGAAAVVSHALSVVIAALICVAVEAAEPPAGFVDALVVPANAVTGAEFPSAVAYEPGAANLWVLERGSGGSEGQARVRVRDATTGLVNTALTLDCVDTTGERGLLGIAFSPAYLAPGGQSRHVYVYYTRRFANSGQCNQGEAPSGSRNRVSRFIESGRFLTDEDVLLEGPYLTATNHNGGTLRFAPDGTLFISMGDNDTDAAANPAARELGDLRGKLLRINADGSIPDDNPFLQRPGARPEIWAWGLRNPFRFSIDSDSEAPIVADVGEGTWEAIYAGISGADYGYPCLEGSATFRVCNPSPPASSITAPIYEYGHGSQTPPVAGSSVTGGPVYRHNAFPSQYHGNYFFGDYVNNWIRRARIAPTGHLVDVELFISDADNVVDIVVSPAGCLTWVSLTSSNQGGVHEVCYVGGGNQGPEARASGTPLSGLAPLQLQLTGSLSTDPDDDVLLYTWDLGDGTASTVADPNHIYATPGVYEAVLSVDDQRLAPNSIDKAPPVTLVAGNRQPSLSIDMPTAGSSYDAADRIAFAGRADDPEEGPLAPDQLSWSIAFHHDTHTHPFLGPIQGVDVGDFSIPTTGEDATDVFFRIHLTATDTGVPLGSAAQLSSSTFVDVLPNVSDITLAADPPGVGLQLELDRQAATAPSTWESIVSFPRSVSAPSPQVIDGWTYVFDSWSDGGLAEHTISTPPVATTYTARFLAHPSTHGFTDDPLTPGTTRLKAVHFMELRARIDALRAASSLAAYPWTDHPLQPGLTPVKALHLSELRGAVAQVYGALSRTPPTYTDAGTGSVISATHISELRAAVVAVE